MTHFKIKIASIREKFQNRVLLAQENKSAKIVEIRIRLRGLIEIPKEFRNTLESVIIIYKWNNFILNKTKIIIINELGIWLVSVPIYQEFECQQINDSHRGIIKEDSLIKKKI